MYNATEIINLALQSLGLSVITNIDEPSNPAAIWKRIYEFRKKYLFERKDWPFLESRVENITNIEILDPKTIIINARFVPRYKAVLPAGFINIISGNSNLYLYCIQFNKSIGLYELYTPNEVRNIAITIGNIDEVYFPCYFTDILINLLCYDIAMSINRQEQAVYFYRQYESLLQQTANIESTVKNIESYVSLKNSQQLQNISKPGQSSYF